MKRYLSLPPMRLSRLAWALAGALPVWAQAEVSTMLDSMVVTGSRVEHPSFDLPAAVDVVTRTAQSADQLGINASEALAGVPGISVANRQNYAQDLQISSRGFGSRAAFGVRGVRLVADGIPASMPDGQGQAATFNLDRAERIEVMRGPMSAIYGNHAGGVIQMFTADGKGAPSIESGFSAGSYGSWKADLGVQGEAGALGYVIDTSRFATDGYREHGKAQRDQSLVKLTYRPSEDGKLTFVANSFHQTADDPQGLTWDELKHNPRGVAYDSANKNYPALAYDTRKTIDHAQAGINYEHRFGDQSINLAAYAGQRSTVQYQSIPRATQLITGSTAATAPVRKQAGGVVDFDRDFAGVNARWTGRFGLAGGQLSMHLGVDYEQAIDDRRGYENYVGTTLGVRGGLRRKETDTVSSFDQYAQAEWMGERWTFSGGLRHSHVAFKVDDQYIATGNGDDSGRLSYEAATPTAAALYRLSDAVNLYASMARGFETPTFNEMFYSSSGGAFNYRLKPAKSMHYEVGAKAMLGQGSRLDLALFRIDTEDELVVLSSSGGRTAYQNAGKTQRHGAELAFDSRWTESLSSRIAYTWLDARYTEDFTFNTAPPTVVAKTVESGNKLPGVAQHNLFGELVWRHRPSGFHAAIEGVARGKVVVEDTNTAKEAPGYAIANLRMGLEREFAGVKLRGFVRLDNIFDRQYVGSVIVGDGNSRYYESAPGRNWMAGVSARYTF